MDMSRRNERTPLDDARHPASLTPRQRLLELASLFARAVVRLAAADAVTVEPAVADSSAVAPPAPASSPAPRTWHPRATWRRRLEPIARVPRPPAPGGGGPRSQGDPDSSSKIDIQNSA